MEELRRKQKLKRRLYSLPSLIALAFVTFVFIRGTYGVFQKRAESARYVQALEAKESSLETEQTQLTHDIQSLGTDAGLEKEIKEKYNVALPGEHVVILVDRQDTVTSTPPDSRAWYQKFWDAILGAL